MSLPFRPSTLLPMLAALALSGALSGCNKQEPTNKAAAGTALLPRSVTDDMPAYDTARSQNPHQAPEEELPQARRAAGAASEPGVDADADAAAAAAEVDAAAAEGTDAVKPAGE